MMDHFPPPLTAAVDAVAIVAEPHMQPTSAPARPASDIAPVSPAGRPVRDIDAEPDGGMHEKPLRIAVQRPEVARLSSNMQPDTYVEPQPASGFPPMFEFGAVAMRSLAKERRASTPKMGDVDEQALPYAKVQLEMAAVVARPASPSLQSSASERKNSVPSAATPGPAALHGAAQHLNLPAHDARALPARLRTPLSCEWSDRFMCVVFSLNS